MGADAFHGFAEPDGGGLKRRVRNQLAILLLAVEQIGDDRTADSGLSGQPHPCHAVVSQESADFFVYGLHERILAATKKRRNGFLPRLFNLV